VLKINLFSVITDINVTDLHNSILFMSVNYYQCLTYRLTNAHMYY